MALNKNESVLLEAVKGLLSQDALGLHFTQETDETSHHSAFRWEGIDDAFALKMSNSPFFESITSAFYAVHAHKYLDNPTFKLSLVSELKSRAIPETVIKETCKVLDGLVNGMSAKKPSERDAGWNPNLKEIADDTRNADTRSAKRPDPFTGGGPWAEAADNDYFDLLISEGVVNNEKSKQYVTRYRRLKGMDWAKARPMILQLAEGAHKAGFTNLARDIERHINIKEDEELKKLDGEC